MSFILGSPVSDFVLETSLKYIEDALFTAGKYDGKIFGGFVHNVIVPRRADPSCNVSFGDIDVWFTKETLATQFVQQMQTTCSSIGSTSSFTEVQLDTLGAQSLQESYGFTGKRYNFCVHGTCIAWFDITISELFPICDFDVNCLSYLCEKEYRMGASTVITKELKSENIFQNREYLIKAILDKEATIYVSYAEKAVKNELCLARINRLIASGWTINLRESKLTLPINKDQLSVILDLNRKPISSEIPTCSSVNANVQEKLEIKLPSASLNNMVENFIRDNPIVKEAIINNTLGDLIRDNAIVKEAIIKIFSVNI